MRELLYTHRLAAACGAETAPQRQLMETEERLDAELSAGKVAAAPPPGRPPSRRKRRPR